MLSRGSLVLGIVLVLAISGCREEAATRNASDTAVDYFLLRAGEALEAGDAERALDLARQALRADSLSARAAFVAGEALQRLGRSREAATAFRHTARLDPDFPEAHLRLGNIAYERGATREALGFYRDEVARRPTATAWYNVGVAYVGLGRTDSARAALEKTLDLDPNHALAWLALSEVNELTGDDAAALSAAERSLSLSPDLAVSRKRVALLYLQSDRVAEAAAHLAAVTARDPLDAEAHYSLGQAYQRLGRTADADRSFARHQSATRLLHTIADLRLRIDENPSDLDAARRLAVLLIANRRHDEAIGIYRRILAAAPDDLNAHTELATALAAQGDVKGAESHYRTVLERDPNRARVWLYLGTLLHRNGRAAEGQEAFDRAVRLDASLRPRVDSLRHAG
ncbi:MAG TPA: tetratricopeptide repeat protein [Rhodothermales bacterium]